MNTLFAFARAFAGSWPGFPLSLSQSSEILEYHAIPLLHIYRTRFTRNRLTNSKTPVSSRM
ncbi:hypothetical protein SAMN05445504_8738 [Burkholderia sp. CF099]|nr:hypothetical protein SAMN05445504_8738 [Burkholderia sp. CF099]